MAKKNKGKVIQMLSPENYIRQKARTLPVYECWVNTDWKDDGIANITIGRKHPNGNITMGLYLVDLQCLGVKDATYKFNISTFEYREYLERIEEAIELEQIPYNLAHNIIFAGIEFAEDYNFKPHKDFAIAQYILEEDTDDIELIEIDCGGEDGKPLYIQGSLDNNVRANQVIAHLEKHAGPGNYDFILATDDDLYDENEDGYRQWEEKYGNVPLNKKIDMFTEMVENIEDLPEADQNNLAFLTRSILDNFIDHEKADYLIENLLQQLQNIGITDEPIDGFLGIEPNADIDKDKLKTHITEIYYLANSNIKEAQKELNKIKSEYPDIPSVYFLELVILQIGITKKYGSKVEEYYQKFPDYSLIKIENALFHGRKEVRNRSEAFFENGFDEFFNGRTKLHPIEILHYLMLLGLTAMVEKNITCLEVLDELIEEMDLEGVHYQQISDLITTGRLSFILWQKEILSNGSKP